MIIKETGGGACADGVRVTGAYAVWYGYDAAAAKRQVWAYGMAPPPTVERHAFRPMASSACGLGTAAVQPDTQALRGTSDMHALVAPHVRVDPTRGVGSMRSHGPLQATLAAGPLATAPVSSLLQRKTAGPSVFLG